MLPVKLARKVEERTRERKRKSQGEKEAAIQRLPCEEKETKSERVGEREKYFLSHLCGEKIELCSFT